MKVSFSTLLLLCCAQILISCVPLPEEDRVTHKIIRSSFESIKHEFPDVKLSGTGGGVSDEGIRLIIMSVTTFGKMDKKVARSAVLRMAEILLNEINSDMEHRRYLATSPFTSEDITLTLLIRTGDNRTILPPDIFAATVDQGKLYYFTYDNSPQGLESTEIESYEDAQKKAKESLYRVKN